MSPYEVLETRKKKIRSLLDNLKEVAEGDEYFVIPKSWTDVFFNTEYDSTDDEIHDKIGPIDTKILLNKDGVSLKSKTSANFQELTCVPPSIMHLINEWYGLAEDSHMIKRHIIADTQTGQLELEYYPLNLAVRFLVNLPLYDTCVKQYHEVRHFLFSRQATQEQVCESVLREYGFTEGFEAKLLALSRGWDYPSVISRKEWFDKKIFNRCSSMEVLSSCQVVVDVKEPGGLIFPSDDLSGSKFTDGTMGLSNLGNTCYMNSALQCMTHIPELFYYFVFNQYLKEINEENPLGYGGAIANSFGHLMHGLYGVRPEADSSKTFTPREFRTQVGLCNALFAGFHQQDSQEFLAFLRDGLHEDLNRIKKKPYVEKPELGDDEVNNPNAVSDLAKQCWDQHLLRNDSIINDLFVGMYKSTLVCPECSKVSITFDPYSDLTLPLPVTKKWYHKITFLGENGYPKCLEVELEKNTTYTDLKVYVAKTLALEPNQLIGADIFNCQFYRIFENLPDSSYMPINDLITTSDQIVFYEVVPGDHHIPCFNTCKSSEGRVAAFGNPFFISINSEEEKSFGCIRGKLERKYGQLSTFQYFHPESRGTYTAQDFPLLKEEVPSSTFHADPSVPGDYAFSIKVFGESNENKYFASSQSETQLWVPHTSNNFANLPSLIDKLYGLERMLHMYPNIEDYVIVEGSEDEPLISNKTAFVCEWEHAQLEEFFVDPGTDTWREPEVVINNELSESKAKLKNELGKTINLSDCLNLFSQPEILGNHDLWYCPRCKEHRQATKTIELWSSPDILTVHLKRFENQSSLSDKIDSTVNFPISGLDLAPHIVDPNNGEAILYDLFAVDNHYGGMGGGHYTAYVKNFVDSIWYYYDDSRTTPADPQDSISGSAYLLLYRKRSTTSLGGLSAMVRAGEKELEKFREEQERLRQLCIAFEEREVTEIGKKRKREGLE